jgi:NAD(P)-dependent dehydrogenase (short-subunit alcohol dehydrogenase family)
MELGLKDRVILVTSGSKGIGLACAFAFAAEGAQIAICSRSRDNVERARVDLKDAFGVVADLTDTAAARKMISAVEDRLGPVDVLVNCAGAARRTPPHSLTPEVWREAFDAKSSSYINVVDPMVKRMVKRSTSSSSASLGSAARSPRRRISPAARSTRR